MAGISLEEFKKQVVHDYEQACLGEELYKAISFESDCRYVTKGCDIAQVALAKFVKATDNYISAGLDLTFDLVRGKETIEGFLERLYSSSVVLQRGVSTGLLPIAIGATMADKIRGGGNDITICCIGGDFVTDGDFLESVYWASAQQLPIAIVLWNNSGEHTNGNLMKQLSGFANMRKNEQTLQIQSVKGGDYPALCRTFESQLSFTRECKSTSLIFVEQSYNSMQPFAQWITDKGIATESQLREIEASSHQRIERERKQAYYKSLVGEAPVRYKIRTLDSISGIVTKAHECAIVLDSMPNIVNKAIGISLRGLRPIVEANISEIRSSMLNGYTETPLVIRTTETEIGSLLSALPQLKVCCPCNKKQADNLYEKLVREGEQAVVFEYGDSFNESVYSDFEMGHVHVEAVGVDVTLLCFGATVAPSVDASNMLKAKGIKADVIDVCSLRPFDIDGFVVASLQKTKRLFIADCDKQGTTSLYMLGMLALHGNALSGLNAQPVVVKPANNQLLVEAGDIYKAVVVGLNKE